MFFATDWSSNYQHFASLADAVSFAKRFGANAVVYGPKGEVCWLPSAPGRVLG